MAARFRQARRARVSPAAANQSEPATSASNSTGRYQPPGQPTISCYSVREPPTSKLYLTRQTRTAPMRTLCSCWRKDYPTGERLRCSTQTLERTSLRRRRRTHRSANRFVHEHGSSMVLADRVPARRHCDPARNSRHPRSSGRGRGEVEGPQRPSRHDFLALRCSDFVGLPAAGALPTEPVRAEIRRCFARHQPGVI